MNNLPGSYDVLTKMPFQEAIRFLQHLVLVIAENPTLSFLQILEHIPNKAAHLEFIERYFEQISAHKPPTIEGLTRDTVVSGSEIGKVVRQICINGTLLSKENSIDFLWAFSSHIAWNDARYLRMLHRSTTDARCETLGDSLNRNPKEWKLIWHVIAKDNTAESIAPLSIGSLRYMAEKFCVLDLDTKR